MPRNKNTASLTDYSLGSLNYFWSQLVKFLFKVVCFLQSLGVSDTVLLPTYLATLSNALSELKIRLILVPEVCKIKFMEAT